MISQITLGGLALHHYGVVTTRLMRSATGLLGVSPMRRATRPRPQGHGSIDETRWTDERLIVLEGECLGSTPEAAMAEFRTIIAVALTAQEVPVLLTWTEGTAGGTPGPLQQYVKLAGASEPVLEGGSSRVRYQLQLSAADPRAYSTTLTTATGATFGTSGLTLFTNSGNRPTPALIRIYPSNTGNLTSALVTNLGAPGGPYPVGQIQCTSDAIAAGSGNYLEIDLATRSATLVTSGITRTPRNDMINSASTRWFEGFEPGVSTLGCSGSGSTTNARVDVLGRSAYA